MLVLIAIWKNIEERERNAILKFLHRHSSSDAFFAPSLDSDHTALIGNEGDHRLFRKLQAGAREHRNKAKTT